MKRNRITNLTTGPDSERGASSASVIIILVVVLMIAELIMMSGRIAAAHNDASTAAREAARSGSLALGGGSVEFLVEEVGGANLANLENGGSNCAEAEFNTNGTDFRRGGTVTANIVCTVDLSDLSILGLPWPDLLITAEHTEIIETYRVVE